MTHFGDDLYLGSAKSTPTASNPYNHGVGVGPMGRTHAYDIVPLTKQAAGYASSQTVTGASNLVLSAGTGVTASVNSAGQTIYSPDVSRTVTITSAGNDTGTVFTPQGYDRLGQLQTEAITGSNGGTATGKKAFASILSIATSGSPASTVQAGTSDVLGLPIAITDRGYCLGVGWANALARDAGTLTVADSTSPATATTGDVRGTYQPSSATNGTNRLVFTYALSAIQAGPNATFAGLLGVTPA